MKPDLTEEEIKIIKGLLESSAIPYRMMDVAKSLGEKLDLWLPPPSPTK